MPTIADAYVFDAVRTPIGRGRSTGKLHTQSPLRLVTVLLQELSRRYPSIEVATDEVILGCSEQYNDQGGNLARASALQAGLRVETPGLMVSRFCGSGLDAVNIAAAKLHADKSHLSIDYRCTTVEEVDPRERFDIVLAMEVVEHVVDVGVFLKRCASMLKPNGLMVVSTLNRNWKSFALAIVGAEYVLRWLPRGTHEWNKFVTPDELTRHLLDNRLVITEQAGVVYSPFADKWSLSSDTDVNYMVVAEAMV